MNYSPNSARCDRVAPFASPVSRIYIYIYTYIPTDHGVPVPDPCGVPLCIWKWEMRKDAHLVSGDEFHAG